VSQSEWKRASDGLLAKIARLPFTRDYRTVAPALFVAERTARRSGKVKCITADNVFAALK
jgi:hypothetical protein